MEELEELEEQLHNRIEKLRGSRTVHKTAMINELELVLSWIKRKQQKENHSGVQNLNMKT